MRKESGTQYIMFLLYPRTKIYYYFIAISGYLLLFFYIQIKCKWIKLEDTFVLPLCQYSTARCKGILFSVDSFLFSELISLVLTMKNTNFSLKQKNLKIYDVFALKVFWVFFFSAFL